jgi:hypothetical protein
MLINTVGTGIGIAKNAKFVIRGEDPTYSLLENGIWRDLLGR